MPVRTMVPARFAWTFRPVIGIGGHDELALPYTEQVVFKHQPVNPFWFTVQPFRRNSAVIRRRP